MKLTFSEWSVKFHISAVARAPFNLHVHFRTCKPRKDKMYDSGKEKQFKEK